jgi:tRNA(Phe) wybutosine-synthesizing methylase Tyw3
VAKSVLDPTSLVGSWSHSHEEDDEGAQVFRPADYDFPPSRGRETFTLHPDGTAVTGMPGPDDRGILTDGCTWQLQANILHVRCPGWAVAYEVVNAAPQRLKLRPVN